MRAGDLAGAESFYRHSLSVDPRHALTYAHLALARAAQGDRPGAIALLRQALAIREDRDAMYNLAGFLFAEGDLAGAERWLRETLRNNPDDEEARNAFARVQASRFHH
jgi:Flp pilus assembly protein TadD